MHRLGVDLGGTKISIAAIDDDGTVRYSARRPTPQGSYSRTLSLIAEMVLEAERESGPSASLGIGTPGSVGLDSGLIRNANSVCLNGKPLKRDLETLLGREVHLENDANCFALSEAADGAGRGAHVVFGVILGTGCGGGIVIDGQLLEGANRIAGEWGHNPLPNPAQADLPLPRCYCGRDGCIETYLSGPGLAADFRRESPDDLSAIEIVGHAHAGDHDARRVLGRYHERLARSLATVINLIDPDVIVLGGGMSNVESLYEEVPRIWSRYIFSDSVRTVLRKNLHGDDSGVLGAARLNPSAMRARS